MLIIDVNCFIKYRYVVNFKSGGKQRWNVLIEDIPVSVKGTGRPVRLLPHSFHAILFPRLESGITIIAWNVDLRFCLRASAVMNGTNRLQVCAARRHVPQMLLTGKRETRLRGTNSWVQSVSFPFPV